ncbi:hypothetical protein [Neisseria bacilliformis]|uniref:hypothetical protein n=1 Tax=Neisseria bacilliformis TaxID=267212 RepID=UPI0028EB9E91|nr:hypothetical protein [Neisseria bacilliformis]
MAWGEISVVMILSTVSQPDKASTEAKSSKTGFRRNFGENIFSLKLKKKNRKTGKPYRQTVYYMTYAAAAGTQSNAPGMGGTV